jgi:hypothetical protein
VGTGTETGVGTGGGGSSSELLMLTESPSNLNEFQPSTIRFCHTVHKLARDTRFPRFRCGMNRIEIKKLDYEVSGSAASQKKARKLLNISSEHKLRSENLPFDIDVVCPRFTVAPSFC